MILSNLFNPPPFNARHYKRTFVASPEDEASQPSRAVIEFALDAVRRTLDVDVASVCERMPHANWSPGTWPGEHYRLLAGMDNKFEPAFAANLNTIAFEKAPWVVFDDIRDRNMLRFWRELDKPKLDLSSFGHWTGTGLVRWGSALLHPLS
jgi:hypothetical protein